MNAFDLSTIDWKRKKIFSRLSISGLISRALVVVKPEGFRIQDLSLIRTLPSVLALSSVVILRFVAVLLSVMVLVMRSKSSWAGTEGVEGITRVMATGAGTVESRKSFPAIGNSLPIILDVKKSLPLSDQDPTYKDYYLSWGNRKGLHRGDAVKVYRSFGIQDARGGESMGNLRVLVGQLRIIFAQDNLSVAREISVASREEEPLLNQVGFSVGDTIERVPERIPMIEPQERKKDQE